MKEKVSVLKKQLPKVVAVKLYVVQEHSGSLRTQDEALGFACFSSNGNSV